MFRKLVLIGVVAGLVGCSAEMRYLYKNYNAQSPTLHFVELNGKEYRIVDNKERGSILSGDTFGRAMEVAAIKGHTLGAVNLTDKESFYKAAASIYLNESRPGCEIVPHVVEQPLTDRYEYFYKCK